MVSSRRALEKCQKLKELGYTCLFEAGRVIARGFADLGFEEFALLTSSKMVSLYSGQSSVLVDDHKMHFFNVPTCDELVNFNPRPDNNSNRRGDVDARIILVC